MLKTVIGLVAMLAMSACALQHATMDIPPPGGCDQCHRKSIGGDWELAIAPVQLGQEGGIPESGDVVMREVRQIPFHADVPSKRLSVFAATAPPETVTVEEDEASVQCFICHRSPDPPHDSVRGRFPHPWDRKGPVEP